MYTNVIMKTMCPLGYQHNRTSCAQVHELPQSHCGDNREGNTYIYIYIYVCVCVCVCVYIYIYIYIYIKLL